MTRRPRTTARITEQAGTPSGASRTRRFHIRAALLALAGQYGSVPEMCRVAIKETEAVTPDTEEAAIYAKAHRVYQSIYPALKPICAEIAEL